MLSIGCCRVFIDNALCDALTVVAATEGVLCPWHVLTPFLLGTSALVSLTFQLSAACFLVIFCSKLGEPGLNGVGTDLGLRWFLPATDLSAHSTPHFTACSAKTCFSLLEGLTFACWPLSFVCSQLVPCVSAVKLVVCVGVLLWLIACLLSPC